MTLELLGLSVSQGDAQPLFGPLTLTVAAGEVATIMGPSGAGKSTLLDAIGGHLAHGFTAAGRGSCSTGVMSPRCRPKRGASG